MFRGYRVRVAYDDREPCICGRFDCGPGHDPGKLAFSEWAQEAGMDRPQVRNPLSETPSRPVFVHETVYEEIPIARTKISKRILKFNVGTRLSVEEAQAYGVPLLDEHREPLNAAQRPKSKVETQDVAPPKRSSSKAVVRRKAKK
jgi:hypothetical protein